MKTIQFIKKPIRILLMIMGVFIGIYLFFFLFLGTSFALTSETKIWQTTDSSGDPDIADPIVNKNVYIDPTYSGSPRDGSISQPYNNSSEIPAAWIISPANKTYLFKRGTTHYGSINFSNQENINIGAYGEGMRPKIIYTGDSYAVSITFYGNPTAQQSSSTHIVGLDISATKDADALIKLTSNTLVENCYLHNAQWGIRSTGAPIGDPSNVQNVKIKNSVVEDIADDGIMLQDVNGILIEDNLIRTVNQNYYLVGPTQEQAAGDGIQFVANANWQVVNNKIDRSDTANKFNFITSYDKAIQPNVAIIEGNTFISPRASDQGGAIFYGGYDVGRGYQNTGDGYTVYMINNIFSGALSDTALSSVWYHGENLYSIGNVYKSMTSCLTNRWFKSGISQVPIYSYGDEFLSCTNSTIGNVIITNENNISILSTPYISSGTMGVRGITGFYKGTIDIKADVFDFENIGISGSSCEYSIGGSRLPANYYGTTTTGYCYQTDIAGGSDLTINFRVKNLSGDEGLGTSRYFVYDNVPPTFTFANTSGPECQTGTMSITSPYDMGGLHAIPYSFNGIDWTGTTTTIIPAQQPGTQIRTGWVRDIPRTQSYQTATYTFTNIVPTANNFTGDTNVGSSSQTANWTIGSSVTEGTCGNGSISYSGIIVQGNKGICSVVGDIITYTPNDNQVGTDSCTIQIKDNENSTFNVIVYREGISTAENDYAPDQFTLHSITEAETNTPYISNTIIITGMTQGIFTGISIDNGTLFKNGINIGQSGTGGNDDTFEIILTSSDTYNTKVSSRINIGGVTGTFDITTRLDSGIFNTYQVYIDPTYTGINGTENGTIGRPFNSWTDITGFQSNVDYLQKKGTTYTSATQIFLSAKNNVTIGSYGTGTRPLFSYLGGGYAIRIELSNNITVDGFEINGNAGAHSLIGLNNHATINPLGLYFFNNKIDDCVLHNAHNPDNAGFGIHASYNDGLKILNTTIYNVAVDGIYTRYEPNIEIGYCNIYDVNRRYFEPGHQNQIYSNGDGIQLDGYWNGFHIHHTTIDRTNGAANKFNLILSSAGASANASGILEYNTFVTDTNISAAAHIEHGNGIITRYNTFKGATIGLTVGITAFNNIIHNNIFYGCSRGVSFGWNSNKPNPDKVYNNVFYGFSGTNYVNGDRYPPAHIFIQQGSNVEIKNNIHVRTNDVAVSLQKWGNLGTATISHNCYGTLATASFSDANAVIANPLFVNGAAADFHLQSGSPCIDAGTGVGILEDFDGTPIPQGGTADIGAFEYLVGVSDVIFPIISQAYIFSGITGDNGSTGYYKGTIDIRADVSDNVGISGTTCEYTTGGSRNVASYSGTSTTGYCYKTNIVGGSDMTINFRVKDTSNNIGIGTNNNYLYDNIAPSYTFSSSSGYECVTGLLQILGANDLGIGLHTIPYSFDQFNWDTNTSLTILPQQPGILTKTGYVRDIFGNQSIQTTTYTVKNSPITSNPFTISTSVVNNTVTGNWKILSNSSDLRCGSGDISFSGIVTQGIKGICSVIGDIISYTPSINKTGSDSCTIQIKDNENSIANVVATWTGINTMNENTYYISYSSGNDSNNGTSISTPWKTISKVNQQAFLPGDSILFKRGDTWTNETITINSIGTSTGTITYGAYGTGEKPKISGFTTISGWTNEGSGVYSKNITGQSKPNMVSVNDINTAIGRWPNSDAVNSGWLTFESHSGNTSITDNELTGTPNWSGAEIVVRKHHWIIDRMLVTNHSGSTITYTGGSSYNGIDGYGYFIQNDIKTLDQVGERSYTSGKFYMYFGANNPNSYAVKVSTMDRLFNVISKHYINIQDISFEGANDAHIFLQTSNNINITGCDINFGGFDGIRVRNASNLSISYSTIYNTHNNALDVDTYGGSSTGTYFGHNTVKNNSLHPGMGGNGDGNGFAVSAQSDNSITEYNVVENVGYIGIAAVGEGYIVRNNIVNNFCLVKDDGSGIYTYLHVDSPKPSTTRKIENNIVVNGVGNVHGTTNTHGYANGIYMDGYSEKVIISGNTVIGSTQAGLLLGWQSKDIEIYNNTFFNNKDQILISRTLDVPSNYTFNNNILINRNATQRLIHIITNSIDSYTIDKLGTWDNNHYIHQGGDDAIAEVVYKIAGKQYSVGYNLARWKTDIDSNAKNTMPLIPKHTLNGLIGSNKFANSGFTTNISNTSYSYQPGTNSGYLIRTRDNTNKIDGGSFKFDYGTLSNYSNSAIAMMYVGATTTNTHYIAKFSTLGTHANRTLRVRLNNNISPYPILTPEPYYTLTNTRTDYEIPLYTSGGASSTNFYLIFSDIDGAVYIDNVELYEADVTITDPDDYMMFVYNTGSTNKTVPLSGTYSDINGNVHSSSITIAPYASSILISTTGTMEYIPNAFSFVDITGAEINTLYTSNVVTLSGMSPGISTGISVTSGYLLKNGVTIGSTGTGTNGDQFALALTSSVNYSTLVNATMTIAGVSDIFSITTKAADFVPTIFSFVDITGAEITTAYTSNLVTLSGMSSGSFTGISVSAGYLLKNGSAIGSAGTGQNGDQFSLVLTSSNNYSTTVNATMTIAGVSDTFSLTTKVADYIPNAFPFVDIIGAEVNTLYTSNVVILTGMSPNVFTGISVNSGYLLKNGINIGSMGTGGNGDQFILALTSSNNYSTVVSSIMTIAGITGSFSLTTKAADYIPNVFSFVDKTGAEVNTLYTSNIIILTGMSPNVSTGISVSSGYVLKNGINIGQSGTGANGDQFALALTSSNNYSTVVSSIMTIAGITGSFSLTTKAADYIPNVFSFVDKTGAEVNTLYTSNIIILTGMSPNVSTGISVSSGYVLKNGINIGQSGTGANGDQFILTLTSSVNYSTTINATMTIAGVSDVFSLTTKAADFIPNGFSFTPIIGANVNTVYTSNIITLTGMSPNVFTGISVNAGYLFKNGSNIGQSGTGANGDQFALALTSSNNYSTTVNATITIAGVSDTFSVLTQNNPSYPTIVGAIDGEYYSGSLYISILSGSSYSGTRVNGVWYTLSGFTISGAINSVTPYYLTAYNINGNYSVMHFSIDTATPVTTDNTITTTVSGNQTITLNAHDNGIGLGNTQYCIDILGGTCIPTTIGTSISVTGTSGSLIQRIVRYFSIDLLGNTESVKTSNTITIDEQSPQNIGFTINSGSMYTTGTNILLTHITGTDSWSPLQIAYGTSMDATNWTGWTAIKTQTLDNQNGLKTIFMRFRDAGGNISISSGIIILDTLFPIITIHNTNTTPSHSKSISGSTNEGILYQAITTGTLCDGSLTFSPYQVVTFSGESDNGKKLCYKAVDLAGNISYSISNNIQGIDRTNPVVITMYPTSGIIISGSSTVTFLRSGFDTTLSGYTLYVNGSGYSTTGTSYTLNTMVNGIYTWYVLATDQAGNTGTSPAPGFTLTTSLSGTATIPALYYSGYTTTTFPITLWTNIPAQFSITGNITGAIILPYTGIVNPIVTHFLGLTPGDGTKTIYITFLTGNQTYTIYKSIILDTTAPNIPLLTSPMSGGIISGAFTLNRSSVVDSGAGLSGYQYFVSTTGTFGTGIVSSGFTSNTYVSITNTVFGTSGTYYWYIKAIDRLGNSGVSLAQSFTYNQGYDTIPNIFSLNTIYDASRNTRYGSTTITITGLSANIPVLASITTGSLYISGNMVGTTGYVQNGWTVRIQLVSSNYYNHLIRSTLTIGGISSNFTITTETEDDEEYNNISSNLSTTEKLQIISIFKTLRDVYVGIKQNEFLDSFMIMLQSRIETLGTRTTTLHTRNALQYLYDLVEQYRSIENTNNVHGAAIVDGVYTAPNGKEYIITYDTLRKQFTSPNFTTPKYFPTLDILKYTIDIANPIGSKYMDAKSIKARWGRIPLDGTRQASPYTAPNYKVFYFFKTMEGQYSSYTFTTEKYFSDLASLKEHIYTRNLR